MTLFKDSLRWSLPLFWSGIAFAAFFTFTMVGADAGGSAPFALLPLGWAAAILAVTTALLNTWWRADVTSRTSSACASPSEGSRGDR